MSQGGSLSTGGGPGEVFSVTGTTNQIIVSPETGNVVVSLTSGVSVGNNSVTPPSTGLYVLGKILNAALNVNSITTTDASKNLVSKNLSVNQQVFLTPGTFTYTPSSPGVLFTFVQVLGGSGGGGGVTNSGPVDVICGSGGGGGGYTEAFIPIATIGSSQSVVVGAGGIGVTSANGTDGGISSFGSLLIGNPGLGGSLGVSEGGFLPGGTGGGYSGSSLLYGYAGQSGGSSGPPSGTDSSGIPPYAYAGNGGSCFTGRINEGYAWSPSIGPVSVPGANETEYGVGGPGAFSAISSAPNIGGNGFGGFVFVTEYILS